MSLFFSFVLSEVEVEVEDDIFAVKCCQIYSKCSKVVHLSSYSEGNQNINDQTEVKLLVFGVLTMTF